jgi:hypothetical protein
MWITDPHRSESVIHIVGMRNLSQKLALLEDEESRKALLTIIRNGSTLIWHYVNLHGEYDFTQDIEEQDMLFDMDKTLALKVA